MVTKKRDLYEITHGMSQSTEFASWQAMKYRCMNPRSRAYHRYGGRGIRVCERWIHSFEAFYDDMGPKTGPDYSIERRDNNGHYEPNNCFWATRFEQNRNKSDNHYIDFEGQRLIITDVARILFERQGEMKQRLDVGSIENRLRRGISPEEASIGEGRGRVYEFDGKTLTVPEWAQLLGVERTTLEWRLHNGWSLENTFSSEKYKPRKRYTYNGQTLSLREWSRHLGVSYSTLYGRLHCGMPLEEVFQSTNHAKKNRANDVKGELQC